MTDATDQHELEAKLSDGARPTRADALRLYETDGLVGLGRLAHTARLRRHGDTVVFAADTAAGENTAHLELHPGQSPAERVDALLRIRQTQDDTGQYTALAVTRAEHPDGPAAMAQATESLRTFAVARLLVDNIDHIQCDWSSHGLDVAGLALNFGVSDLTGSTTSYRRTHDTGLIDAELTDQDVLELIRDAGFTPMRRDGDFAALHAYDPPVPAAVRRAEPQKVWT